MATTPYIHCTKNEVTIIGEPENLEALGHALILKSKMGKSLHCTITDGINIPIRIISSDELTGAHNTDFNEQCSLSKFVYHYCLDVFC